MEVGFDGFVLFVELGQIGNEIFNDVGVGKGVDAGLVGCVGGDATYRLISLGTKGYGGAKRVYVDVHRQANVFTPSMFMAQLPQMPSLQLLRNVSVGSTSFFILISASNTIGPVLFRSRVYDCILGFSVGRSGDQR